MNCLASRLQSWNAPSYHSSGRCNKVITDERPTKSASVTHWTELALRTLSVLLALVALSHAFVAFWFRLEGTDELQMIIQTDIAIGAMFALALLVFVAPDCRWQLGAWLRAFIAAAVLCFCVSGALSWWHWRQHEIRSTIARQ